MSEEFFLYSNDKLRRVFSDKNEIFLPELVKSAFENEIAVGNLWQNFLTEILISDENIFTLSCERRKSPEGTLKEFGLHDLKIFSELFNHKVPEQIRNFKNPQENENYICKLSRELSDSKKLDEFYRIITNYYENHGVGILGNNKAFRFENEKITPVKNVGKITLKEIIGYEIQKKELIFNTEAFLSGKPANNVLLYGDGGTGKSSSIKALLNEYYEKGLRIIEIYKHQFKNINEIIKTIRSRNYKFIIFIDDLSFEENETEYKFLKAIIEGGIETRPENILIYATSNRRHIVKELWKDREDMEHSDEVHRSDTLEEKASLSSRFGIALNYSSPDRKTYHKIILNLAENSGLKIPEDISEEKLLKDADTWEIRHGGKSGRAARQYIDYLLGKK